MISKRHAALICVSLWLAACQTNQRASASDRNQDGYPDAAQLWSEDDRQAFIESLVTIALAQAPSPEAAFEVNQRDCAGLIRYAYREALKRHDAAFAARHRQLPRLPEVRAFHYPEIPLLGTRIFRIRPGDFSATTVADDFGEAPEASRLAQNSARPVNGPMARGDLLLFRRPSGISHLMLVASDGPDPWLVYHTGPHDGGAGEVRRVQFSSMLSHPDPSWQPRAGNENFLGVFRFKILGSA